MANSTPLTEFMSTLKWYGRDDVQGFLEEHSEELHSSRSSLVWNSINFANDLHQKFLRNDYEYVLAFFVYRFGDAGAYSYVYDMYADEVKDEPILKMIFDSWIMLGPKERGSVGSPNYRWTDVPKLISIYQEFKEYEFSVYVLSIIYFLSSKGGRARCPQDYAELEAQIGPQNFPDVRKKYFELKPKYGWYFKVLEDEEAITRVLVNKRIEELKAKKAPEKPVREKSKGWKRFLRKLYELFDIKEKIRAAHDEKQDKVRRAEALRRAEEAKREAEEKAKKERELKAKLDVVMQEMSQMRKSNDDEAQYLRSMCGRWKRCIDREDYDNLINELNIYNSEYVPPIDAVHIVDDLELKIGEKGDQYANSCKFYVTNTDGADDYDIYKYLVFEHSICGAFAAYLIYSSWHLMPLGWHANYARRKYIHRRDELIALSGGMGKTLNLAGGEYEVEPVVFLGSDCAYVQCTYWNMWQGLVRETVRITFDEHRAKEFTHVHDEVLYAYNCGITF